ncbi:hypothetical protein BUALT_Bualt19G0042700 [Buddleja alternifolia]|uniref:Leucine-rich repeat-containing N-terminal plant-type domain-containing protein n=1 Tax=Buddleja alternifolia TaxID=168488 RepID=A0AAV6W1Z9_9LAMI|nr:hypothetical protein BUALT_Bualt19G0042700 [Buddleja alternifolia]
MKGVLLAVSLVISIFTSLCNSQTNIAKCLGSDRKELLDFKNIGLNDPKNTLSSWRGVDCCTSWSGISCDSITGGIMVVDLHNPYPFGYLSTDNPRYGFWNLSGEIRPSLIQLKSLTHLDFSFNTFEDITIPEFFGSLKNLQYLNLSNAGFDGIIPQTQGNLSKLQFLDVSNDFTGLAVHDFQWITSLVSLKTSRNEQSQPFISKLELVTNIKHVASTDRVACFSLWLVWSDFVPPLCKLHLTRSTACLVSELPNLRFLNLALNGNLSACSLALFRGSWKKIEVLNLCSNKITRENPRKYWKYGVFLWTLTFLIITLMVEYQALLAHFVSWYILMYPAIKWSKLYPSHSRPEGTEKCGGHSHLPSLMKLRLNNNQLHARLPDWLGQLTTIEELSLDYNYFEGPLPASLGSLQNLTGVGLAGNRLTGTLPENIGQLLQLVVFDVSTNYLTWILSEVHFSNLRKLKILRLSSNSFSLNVSSNWLPSSQIRNLDMDVDLSSNLFEGPVPVPTVPVQLLDLSNNRFQGPIPHNISNVLPDVIFLSVSGGIPTGLGDLKAMAQEQMTHEYLLYGRSGPEFGSEFRCVYYEENLVVYWKNPLWKFTKTLSLVTVIDISGNNLMASLSFLGYLNLSNNNLYGEIPGGGQMSTFGRKAFVGNPRLCGAPVVVECRGEEPGTRKESGNGNDDNCGRNNMLVDRWFYLSVRLGFAAGILVPCLVLVIKKPWSDEYFDFLDKVVSKLLSCFGTWKKDRTW